MISSSAKYRESQVRSHTPAETVLMLYNGAICFLKSAIKELEENHDIPAKAVLVEKTVIIIDYLQSCLDKTKGGIIADNLDELYDYMMIKLTEANLRNDSNTMREIMDLLFTIREGWSKISADDSKARSAIHNKAEVSRQHIQRQKPNAATAVESTETRKIQIKI